MMMHSRWVGLAASEAAVDGLKHLGQQRDQLACQHGTEETSNSTRASVGSQCRDSVERSSFTIDAWTINKNPADQVSPVNGELMLQPGEV